LSLGVARSRENGAMREEIEEYVRSLGLDAYLVGGAVRDELLGIDSRDADFVVPGIDTERLRAALEPHGRVEDLIVAGRLVGVRLHPSDRTIRRLAPAGIELAPTRKEVSTGPGRHDFEIVADPALSVEDDMRRRDFTVNATRSAGGRTSRRAGCAPSRRRASARIRCGSSEPCASSRSSASSPTRLCSRRCGRRRPR
jgi:hypothetical protein